MPACGRPSPPRASVSAIDGGGADTIKVAERHDPGVSRETTRRQDIGFVGLGATIGKQRLGELPGWRERRDLLCDRSLWLGGEQGRVTLERIELPIDLRVDFVIRAADAHCV